MKDYEEILRNCFSEDGSCASCPYYYYRRCANAMHDAAVRALGTERVKEITEEYTLCHLCGSVSP